MSTKLSPHFTLEELTFSEAAARNDWDNTPDAQQTENLVRLADLLEEVRMEFLAPIIINSGYRNEKANAAVGGKPNSQHRFGCAADFRIPKMTPAEICRKIKDSGIIYDQLIQEFDSWVHISVPTDPDGKPRRQALIINRAGVRPFI